jgi:hypothetical protein
MVSNPDFVDPTQPTGRFNIVKLKSEALIRMSELAWFTIRVTTVNVILSEAKNLSRRWHPRGDSSLRSE